MAKRSNKILLFMVSCAILAFGFGVFVLQSRSTPPLQSQQANNDSLENETQTEVKVETQSSPVSTTGWKVYNNDKHGFSIKYPPHLKAGSVSENSVLGTYQVPVRGLHVGPLVLIALKDLELRKEAEVYFDDVYKAAENPVPAQGEEVPPIECKIDNVTNPEVVSIKAVSCTGEGGAAKYAYIDGQAYDVFVDGYSKGYDNADNGEFASTADYITALSTFKFQTETTDSTDEILEPKIEIFTIQADDASATPNEITVTKDSIVQITFNVGSNVYYGGLDFKSTVVNSGTISANSSKTISFKATQSFDFTPYWPASQVAKNYKIKVTVL